MATAQAVPVSDKEKSMQAKKCITGKGRLSFPALFKPKAFDEHQEAKFAATILLDKKENHSAIRAAAWKAGKEAFPDKFVDPKKWPAGIRNPFRDGDEKSEREGYPGHYFVTGTSKTRPGIVNQRLEDIIDEAEVYAGCYVRLSLIAFAYQKPSKGVSFALLNVQKMADGKPFSGRKKPQDEFDVVEEESDNPDNYGEDADTADASFDA